MKEHDEGQQVSWQSVRGSAPTRPEFSSSLAPEVRIERPRRLRGVVVCFALALLAALVMIGTGLSTFEDVRGGILTSLPEDLRGEYSEESIERAATALLAGIGSILLALFLIQGLSLRSFVTRRSIPARTTFIVAAITTIPVFALAVLLEPYGLAVVSAAAAVAALVTSTVLATGASVSRWLRQSEARRSIPIARSTTD